MNRAEYQTAIRAARKHNRDAKAALGEVQYVDAGYFGEKLRTIQHLETIKPAEPPRPRSGVDLVRRAQDRWMQLARMLDRRDGFAEMAVKKAAAGIAGARNFERLAQREQLKINALLGEWKGVR